MEGFDPYQHLNQTQPAPPSDFFDYVLGAAGSTIGSFMGVMDPSGSQFPYPGSTAGGGEAGNWLAGLGSAMTRVGPLGRAPSPSVAPSPGTGVSGQIGVPSPTNQNTRIANKIKDSFSRRGMDANFALWVAENEGGLDDAAANRRNQQGSQAYGPFQLLLNGGLGDTALAAGIDPRDANTWERQIDFVADYVARNGWGAWEAVTKRGIDPWTGTPGRGGYAPPRSDRQAAPVAQPQGYQFSQSGQVLSGNPYAYYSTTPAVGYTVAFDFDQAYSNPFNPDIPRHRGVDLVIKGAPNGGRGGRVGAFHSGTVVALTGEKNGGNGVIILGDDGLYHRYFHFDSITVGDRQRVERGQPLGILGASGTEGFPHLHYEVSRRMNGDPMNQLIDPRPYLRAAG